MKIILLSLFLLGTAVADEAEKKPHEEVQIHSLESMKDQFSKARKKGWDFSRLEKSVQERKQKEEIQWPSPDGYHPMLNVDQMTKAYRPEISHTERAKIIDRLNELEHKPKKSKK